MSIIAVNTRLLLKDKLDGMGWFTYETLKRITQNHPEHQFVFLFDRKPAAEFIFSGNVKPFVIPPQARHPILWHLWFEYSVAYAIKRIKPDLFLSPEGLLCTRTSVPQVGVVHDLNFEHYPQYLPANVASYYKKWFRKSVNAATRLATVSQFSKTDLINTYNVNASTIDVVCNGANAFYKPLTEPEKTEIKNRLTGGKPYFVFVGALHPRKNVVNMLLAFDKFKNESNSETLFVIVGNRQWWNDEIKTTYESLTHRHEIIFSGRQPVETVANITASAQALVYVSLFEGFGIPILEAMHCDVPVITSNVTSMPEVAGNAALLVNPNDVNAIATAMKDVTQNQTLRHELIVRGKKQRENYSWDKAAQLLWKTVATVLKQTKPQQ